MELFSFIKVGYSITKHYQVDQLIEDIIHQNVYKYLFCGNENQVTILVHDK